MGYLTRLTERCHVPFLVSSKGCSDGTNKHPEMREGTDTERPPGYQCQGHCSTTIPGGQEEGEREPAQ